MTSMPTTMVPQGTDSLPPATGNRDKGAVTCPTDRSKLFGCTPAVVADVLDRAADRIHRIGLWQGNDPASIGGACAVMAIRRVADSLPDQNAALRALAVHLRLPVIANAAVSAVINWNDTLGRTCAEVCGEIRACAAGLRITSDASGYHAVASVTA